MRFHRITYPDVNNGIGCRVTLWVSGCTHHCKGCHNKETWSFNTGRVFNDEYKNKLFEIVSLPYIKGLTLSGGDPLCSPNEILGLLKEYRLRFGNEKDVWLYTGFTMDEILANGWQDIISMVDYVVDGRFDKNLRDVTLPFRGSSNQQVYRILDGGYINVSDVLFDT